MNQKQKGEKPAEELGGALSGLGIGERENFLGQDNHIFINKLNYICKNYDQSFKDVSASLLYRSASLTLYYFQPGKKYETAGRRVVGSPGRQAETRGERELRQGGLLAVKVAHYREASADHDSGNPRVLL